MLRQPRVRLPLSQRGGELALRLSQLPHGVGASALSLATFIRALEPGGERRDEGQQKAQVRLVGMGSSSWFLVQLQVRGGQEAFLSARRVRMATARGTSTGLPSAMTRRPASQPRTVRSETSKARANSGPVTPRRLRSFCSSSAGHGAIPTGLCRKGVLPPFRLKYLVQLFQRSRKSGWRHVSPRLSRAIEALP